MLQIPVTRIEELEKRCTPYVPNDAQGECFKRVGDRQFERHDYRSAIEYYERAQVSPDATRLRFSLYQAALVDAQNRNYPAAQSESRRAGFTETENLVEPGDLAHECQQYADAVNFYDSGQVPQGSLRLRMSLYKSALENAPTHGGALCRRVDLVSKHE